MCRPKSMPKMCLHMRGGEKNSRFRPSQSHLALQYTCRRLYGKTRPKAKWISRMIDIGRLLSSQMVTTRTRGPRIHFRITKKFDPFTISLLYKINKLVLHVYRCLILRQGIGVVLSKKSKICPTENSLNNIKKKSSGNNARLQLSH